MRFNTGQFNTGVYGEPTSGGHRGLKVQASFFTCFNFDRQQLEQIEDQTQHCQTRLSAMLHIESELSSVL